MELNWKRATGIILLVAAVIIASFGLVTGMLSLGTLTMEITDARTGEGIEGAYVYVFLGGGSVQPPENGTFIGATDASGRVSSDLGGFYCVGVIAENYVAASAPHIPLEEWKTVWSAWGACGVARDITYPIEFVAGDGPVVPVDPYDPNPEPDPVEPDPIDPAPSGNGEDDEDDIIWNDPETVEIVGARVPWTLVIAAILSICGGIFIVFDPVYDKFVGR